MAKRGGVSRKRQQIVVTVRPITDPLSGGANIDLAAHLERVGKQVGEAFKKMTRAIGEHRPDELKVTIGLTLEGTANWVLAESKASTSLEIEGTWKKSP